MRSNRPCKPALSNSPVGVPNESPQRCTSAGDRVGVGDVERSPTTRRRPARRTARRCPASSSAALGWSVERQPPTALGETTGGRAPDVAGRAGDQRDRTARSTGTRRHAESRGREPRCRLGRRRARCRRRGSTSLAGDARRTAPAILATIDMASRPRARRPRGRRPRRRDPRRRGSAPGSRRRRHRLGPEADHHPVAAEVARATSASVASSTRWPPTIAIGSPRRARSRGSSPASR